MVLESLPPLNTEPACHLAPAKWIVVLEVFRLLQNDRRKRGTTEVACDKGREVNNKGPYNF